MTRWKLTIEYCGRDYAGWQRQAHDPSVQQAIEEAITGFCQQELRLHVAGRTDAGVHAKGQVAHFDLDYGGRALSGHDLVRALNAHLRGHRISILDACPVDQDFHARFSAQEKTYTYRILNRSAPPSLEKDLLWHVKKPLDVAAMAAGSRHLLGHHDFTTFRDSQCQAKSPLRTLDALEVESLPYDGQDGIEIRIHARARSFLHHQVRNMVGTLALAGEGKWQPEDIADALAAKDRRRGGPTAPAEGLYLVNVVY